MLPLNRSAGRDPFVVFFDTSVDSSGRESYEAPILPNQKYAVPVMFSLLDGHLEDIYGPPFVTAAAFADGTTAGDESLLARLKVRKGNMLQAVELARDILASAGSRNVPKNQLVEQYQIAREFLRPLVSPSRRTNRQGALSIDRGKAHELTGADARICFSADCFRRARNGDVESGAYGIVGFEASIR